MTISVALVFILLAVVLLLWAMRMRQQVGLPWTTVVYRDTDQHDLEKPLFSRTLGLTGKPDYVLKLGQTLVPVEVKPSRRSATPYESDLMQLAAYCVLLEETEGTAPPYGLLRYAERTFRLTYTPAVRQNVLVLIDEMRVLLEEPSCARSHQQASRCQACGFAEQCDEALVSH